VSPDLPHEPPADLAAASFDALIGPLGHGTPNPDFPVTGAVERPVTYPPRTGHRNRWARKAQGRSEAAQDPDWRPGHARQPMPTIGEFRWVPPTEPQNWASPKLKTPPSAATSQ